MTFRLLQISDTHLGDEVPAFNANFDQTARWIRSEAPDLVVHTGDVTRDAPGAPQELIFARDRLDALGAPWLAIPGNHDVGDNPGDGGYMPAGPVSDALLAAWAEVMGPDRWVETRAGWRLVGVNSLLMNSGLAAEAAQWDWLAEALSGEAPIALFLHKPILLDPQATPQDPPYRYLPEGPRARLLALIEAAPVRVIGCGHVHQSRDHALGAARAVWAPATAFVLPDVVQPRIGEKLCGAVLHELRADGTAEHRVIRPDGIEDLDIADFPHAYG